jgi:hypothetical protein
VLYTKYSLGDEVEEDEMEVWHIACMGKRRNAYSALVRNPERKMPLEDCSMGWRMGEKGLD